MAVYLAHTVTDGAVSREADVAHTHVATNSVLATCITMATIQRLTLIDI